MKLTPERKENLENMYQTLLNDERVKKMKDIPMHFGSNCYEHCFKVARLAIKRALRHKEVNLEALLIAAIFHDYYLYDWRVEKDKKKSHASKHPYIAAEQAERDFKISKESKKIIHSHMWPINFKDFPNSKEARILTLADKAIATVEFMSSTKNKKKHREETLKEISTLF